MGTKKTPTGMVVRSLDCALCGDRVRLEKSGARCKCGWSDVRIAGDAIVVGYGEAPPRAGKEEGRGDP